MKLIFSEQAWEDYLHWQATDRKLLERVNGLIKECARTPFQGTGKRRITQEHRLVYRPTEDGLLIAQCRYHY
jgi:toxin YoeB